jgi:hypothetical protein
MLFDRRSQLSARAVRGPQGQRSMRGFGDFGNFGGDWEDWCDANMHDPKLLSQCKQWSLWPPWTALGKSARGLPAGVGNVVTDVLGSLLSPARLPTAEEYEPLNLFHAQLFDPARFIALSAYANEYPPALARGGFIYCNMFVLSPQMFIPGIGGYWLAHNDAIKKGGEQMAADQVLGALGQVFPEYLGFVIDFFLTGWGALAKKCLQLHARNMPEGDGKAFMTAIANNYSSFTDAIQNPDSWKKRSIYVSIGQSMVASNADPSVVATGASLLVMAEPLEYIMNGQWELIGDAVAKNLFTGFTEGHPVLRPNAQLMLNQSSRAISALVNVVAEIKIANIGPTIARAAATLQATLDQLVAKFSAGGQIAPQGVTVTTPDGATYVTTPGAYTRPVNKSDVWKKAAIGAGTGLVVAGPPGAIGGAGIALVLSALKKGTTT